MKKCLFLLIFAIFSAKTIAFELSNQMIQTHGLIFCTDRENPRLDPGESAVFPYSDEAMILLEMISKIKESRGRSFSALIDPFCGDGKSGLPLIFHHIAENLIGSDINPRAIQYAKKNAELNHLETKSCFSVRDIVKEGVTKPIIPGNSLWIANPPFALKAKGADLAMMRDGGENGLALTIAFATCALEASKEGDVIFGIGYSRIHRNGSIELEQELTKLIQRYGGVLELVLLKDQKLWRGFNGKKEQDNPMPITKEIFALKADPLNPAEIHAYQIAAQFHNKCGFQKLGYYAYVIYK